MTDSFFKTFQGGIPGISLEEEARNSLLYCEGGTLSSDANFWVDENYVIDLEIRPQIEGKEFTPGNFVITENGQFRTITGNSIPDHATGTYPIPEDTEAYDYYAAVTITTGVTAADLPLEAFDFSLVLPINPEIADEPSCLPGGTVAVMLTGGFMFNALDGVSQDSQARITL